MNNQLHPGGDRPAAQWPTATPGPAPWTRLRKAWATLTGSPGLPATPPSAADPLLPAAQAVNREIECLAARIQATDLVVASLLGKLINTLDGRSADPHPARHQAPHRAPTEQPPPAQHWTVMAEQARQLMLISREVVARARALEDSVSQLAAADACLHGQPVRPSPFQTLAAQAGALAAAAASRDERVRRHTTGLLDLAHLQMLSQTETRRVIDALRHRGDPVAAAQHCTAQAPRSATTNPSTHPGRPA